MSFVRDILNIVNENDAIDAHKQVAKLLTEIQNYQLQTKEYIEENFVDFLPSTLNNQLLLDEGDRLLEEVNSVLENVNNETKDNLLDSLNEMKQHIEDIEEISLGLKTSHKLLKIDNLFKQLEETKNATNHFRIRDTLDSIKYLIDDPSDPIIRHLKCFNEIKTKWYLEHEMMLHNLKLKFDSLVQFNEKTFQNTKSITIRITKDEELLRETIISLINTNFNTKRLSEFLLEMVFKPIILKPVSLQITETAEEFITLTLSFSLYELADNLKPNYKIVFDYIRKVFECLHYMNIKINNDLYVFQIFANHFKEKLIQLIIGECLIYSIPETMDEMHETKIVDDILELNEFLIGTKFFNTDDNALTLFTEKIDKLFKNRFSINILDSAMEIMHKDLHEMIPVADTDSSVSVSISSSDAITSFPKCIISKSTLELISLMEKILQQARTCKTNELTECLTSSIPSILNRYIIEVPHYHEKLLENIPQQTALYHNNCMYLSYWVAKNVQNDVESMATTIKPLQHSGSEHFDSQMKNQREQIMEILQNFDLSDSSVTEFDDSHNRTIRQCLRQLDLLKNVWQTVLPDTVYNKTMGNIINDFCVEIIQKILALEDLPTTISNGLVDICNIIIERIPHIFKDPLDVTVIVKSWMKFTQLKMILNASLVQITEHWSEGKGPLCLHYKADEIKRLIRALFQNTDRRAKALLTIV